MRKTWIFVALVLAFNCSFLHAASSDQVVVGAVLNECYKKVKQNLDYGPPKEKEKKKKAMTG